MTNAQKSTAAFVLEDFRFGYASTDADALKGVSLEVRQGDFFVLFGLSGCGKSTLLRCLKPSLKPAGRSGGSAFFFGEPLERLDPRSDAARIGFVSQDPEDQIVTDKVWHELAFGLESLGFDGDEIRRRVAETAAFFGIGGWFRKSTSELSGGHKQLLNIASAMVTRPDVLLLDEPSSRLDPIASEELFSALTRINRELGTTIILSEHRLDEAFASAGRTAVMHDGRIIRDGTPRDVAEYLCGRQDLTRNSGNIENFRRGLTVVTDEKNDDEKAELRNSENIENILRKTDDTTSEESVGGQSAQQNSENIENIQQKSIDAAGENFVYRQSMPQNSENNVNNNPKPTDEASNSRGVPSISARERTALAESLPAYLRIGALLGEDTPTMMSARRAVENLRDAGKLRTACRSAKNVGIRSSENFREPCPSMKNGVTNAPENLRVPSHSAKNGGTPHPENLRAAEKTCADVSTGAGFGGKITLKAEDVWFSYDGEPVVRGLDLSVREGEILALIGGNGSGKTTVLRLLAGLIEPDRGDVFRRSRVAMLPQEPRRLFVKSTLREELFGKSGRKPVFGGASASISDNMRGENLTPSASISDSVHGENLTLSASIPDSARGENLTPSASISDGRHTGTQSPPASILDGRHNEISSPSASIPGGCHVETQPPSASIPDNAAAIESALSSSVPADRENGSLISDNPSENTAFSENIITINDAIELCGLRGLLERHPLDLSGGELQRAGIAKLLACGAEILLLDEPTKGTDAAFRRVFAGLLLSLKAAGKTVVIVSHDLEFCAETADRVAMFFDGAIVSEGTPREFFGSSRFYTTTASRIARGCCDAITTSELLFACGRAEPPSREIFQQTDKEAAGRCPHADGCAEKPENTPAIGAKSEQTRRTAAANIHSENSGNIAVKNVCTKNPGNTTANDFSESYEPVPAGRGFGKRLAALKKSPETETADAADARGNRRRKTLRKAVAFVSAACAAAICVRAMTVSDLTAVLSEGGSEQILLALLLAVSLTALAVALGGGGGFTRTAPRMERSALLFGGLSLALVPPTLIFGGIFLEDRKYYFVSLAVLAETMLAFFAFFEWKKPKAREIAVAASLCALGIAGRAAFFMLPQFKPVAAVVIAAGVSLGGGTGFLVGSVTMLASNMIFSQGPWTPWQMFAMGLVGFIAGLLSGWLRGGKGRLCAFGAVSVLVVYGGIMNLSSALIWSAEPNAGTILSFFVTGFPLDCVHAAATALFLWFGAAPLVERLDRLRVKYGLFS